MTISTVAVITARKGAGDEVEKALRILAEATHGEGGCRLYSLQRGLQDTDVFVTVEKWDSEEALEGHMASEHLKTTFATAGHLLAGPPVIVPAKALDVGDPAKSTY